MSRYYGANMYYIVAAVLMLTFNFVQTNNVQIKVKDERGNIILTNGTVYWVTPIPLPEISYKTLPPQCTDSEYMKLPRHFINMIEPGNFQYSLLKKAINGTLNIKKDSQKTLKNASGFLVIVGIGGLYIVIFPVCGCFAFFCWYCNRKKKIKVAKTNECLIFTTIICCILFIVSAVYIRKANILLTEAIDQADKACIDSLHDAKTFLESLTEHLWYIIKDMFNLVFKSLIQDVNNVTQTISKKMKTILKFDDIVNAITEVDNITRLIPEIMSNITAKAKAMKSESDDVTVAIRDINNKIMESAKSCDKDCSPQVCEQLGKYTFDNSNKQQTQMPDFTELTKGTKEISELNLAAEVLKMLKRFDELPRHLEEVNSAIKNQASTLVSDYSKKVYDIAKKNIDNLNLTFDVEAAKNRSKRIFRIIKDADDYRQYSSKGVTYAFIVLAVGVFVGVFFGCLAINENISVEKRMSFSKPAGYISLSLVIVMFLIGPPFMMMTVLTYITAGSLQKVCEPVLNLDIFQNQFIDKNGIPHFSIGKILLNDSSVHITLYDLLVGCRSNKTPYVILHLNETVNLEQYSNYTVYLSYIDQYLSAIQTSSLEKYKMLPEEARKKLTSFAKMCQKTNFSSIHDRVSEERESLSNAFSPRDINAQIHIMQSLSKICKEPSKSKWSEHATEYGQIKERLLSVLDGFSELDHSVSDLEKIVKDLITKTELMVNLSDTATHRLFFDSMKLMSESMLDFRNLLTSYLKSYRRRALEIVYNELGACRPLWNIYQSAIDIVCCQLVDALNGIWFGFEIGLLTFIPAIFVGIKLHKFYTRNKISEVSDSFINSLI